MSFFDTFIIIININLVKHKIMLASNIIYVFV